MEQLDDECQSDMSSCDEPTIKKQKSSNNPRGFASVITKILSQKVSEKKIPVLAKTKKIIRQVDKRKKTVKSEKSEDGSEKEKISKKLEVEKVAVSEFQQQQKRKEWEEMCHVKVSVLDKEKERKLQRIATKGVVTLFNTVRKQQTTIEQKLKEAGTVSKEEKVLETTVSKGHFLDMLKGKNKKKKIESETEVKSESTEEEVSTWGVLRDNFMMDAKMKDWDKQSESSNDS